MSAHSRAAGPVADRPVATGAEPRLHELQRELRRFADPRDAEVLQRFFKTGPGEYGEGDRFLGVRVPRLRALAREFRSMPREQVLALLRSAWHEERLLALLLLVEQYRRGSDDDREAIHEAYLAHTAHIDSWDLVDGSAEHIVGAHLDPAKPALLERLARSESVWERRIAILATFHWIKRGDPGLALRLARLLLQDRHDLIHKAVGWMLREVGKRDLAAEEAFLREHYRTMPRTMLRYAIERFPEELRRQYLRGEV